MRWYAPNHEPNPDPYYHMPTTDYSSLGTMGGFERILDRLQRAYGSHRQMPIYDTEFGYITSPPKRRWSGDKNPYISQTTAAYYLNWAEYLSWHSSRIASYMQYLLKDAWPTTRSDDYGNFASGLLNYNGTPKPTYAAFRLPLYLPTTSAKAGSKLQVWGCVRPSHYLLAEGVTPPAVQIQVAPGSNPSDSAFQTVSTVAVTNPKSCYFDVPVAFPGSGAQTVRLVWQYPTTDPNGWFAGVTGTTIASRNVLIQLH